MYSYIYLAQSSDEMIIRLDNRTVLQRIAEGKGYQETLSRLLKYVIEASSANQKNL